MKTTRVCLSLLVLAVLCPGFCDAASNSSHPLQAALATNAPGSGPTTIRFQRKWEPNEKAFSFLLPAGWTFEGGMFHVDPTQSGGPGNSLDSKCDLHLKKDPAATVAFRWLPTWNYADMSRNPQMTMVAGMFPPGARYQGMEVRPMPTSAQYLRSLFGKLRPTATDVNVVQSEPIPELEQVFIQLYKQVNDQQRMLGMPPLQFDAAGLVVDYTEGPHRYREALVTCLVDFRAAAAMWSNLYTLDMRAPAEQADDWKPVLDIIRQSVQFNPQWVAAAVRAAGQRGQIVQDTMKAIQNIDRQIYASRSQTNADIQHENYLVLTGQEEYVNPFTKEVEQDTNEYQRRWTTSEGDRIYTNQEDFNPNAVQDLNHQTWKLTPVRPR